MTRHKQKFIMAMTALVMAFVLALTDHVTDPVVALFALILGVGIGGNVASKLTGGLGKWFEAKKEDSS